MRNVLIVFIVALPCVECSAGTPWIFKMVPKGSIQVWKSTPGTPTPRSHIDPQRSARLNIDPQRSARLNMDPQLEARLRLEHSSRIELKERASRTRELEEASEKAQESIRDAKYRRLQLKAKQEGWIIQTI